MDIYLIGEGVRWNIIDVIPPSWDEWIRLRGVRIQSWLNYVWPDRDIFSQATFITHCGGWSVNGLSI